MQVVVSQRPVAHTRLPSMMLRAMMNSLRSQVLAVAGAVALLSADAQAQCRPADDYSANMIEFMQRIATAPTSDLEWARRRTDYGIPAVAASKVVLVTAARTCKSALEAYLANLAPGEPAPTAVYVVAVGSTYVVWAPRLPNQHFGRTIVFSSKFVRLAAFAG